MSLKKNLLFAITGLFCLVECSSGDQFDSSDSSFTSLPEYGLESVLVLSDQGDLLMGRPSYTQIDSDGNHIVMDLGSMEFHVFNGEGVHQTSFGRQGDGPGELQQPRRPIMSEQDTLYVTDNIRRSLIVYTRTDDYTWEHAYDISFPATEEGYPFYALTPTEQGYPIVYSVNDDSDEFPNGYTTVKLINRAGELIRDTGVRFNSGEMLEVNMQGTQIRLGLSELYSSEVSPHPDGSYLQAWNGDPMLYHFSAAGDTLHVFELNGYPKQPVSSEAISKISDNYGPMFGELEADLSSAIGDYFPLFSEVLVMNDHSIWLRRIMPGDSRQSWYHLTPDGKPQGMLTLEEGESLRNSSSDVIYVSGEDESGAPVIIKYRLSEKMPDGAV